MSSARPVGLAVGGEGNRLGETSKRTGFICLRPPNVHILREEARQQLPGSQPCLRGLRACEWPPRCPGTPSLSAQCRLGAQVVSRAMGIVWPTVRVASHDTSLQQHVLGGTVGWWAACSEWFFHTQPR